MTQAADPHTKDELLLALAALQRQAVNLFSTLPANVFITAAPDAWSPAQNLDHLIRSVRPVAQALRLPKWLLRLLFGRSPNPSRSYGAVCDEYLAKLAAGAEASGRYLPAGPNPAAAAGSAQEGLLQQWESVCSDLVAALSTWSEGDLDKHRLPHPLLGKLTVREMLFFTLYHIRHHTTEKLDNKNGRLYSSSSSQSSSSSSPMSPSSSISSSISSSPSTRRRRDWMSRVCSVWCIRAARAASSSVG